MVDVRLTTTSDIPSGAGIDVTIYEDTNNDGTADNSATITLSGGSNETNTASGFDLSKGNDFWLDVEYTAGSGASLTDAQIDKARGIASGITGVVEDESGNVINGATVELINQTDGTVQSTTTNSNGVYEFTGLDEADTYHVVARTQSGGDDFRAEAYPFVEVTSNNVVTAQAVSFSRRQNGIGAKRIENVTNVRTYEAQYYDRRRGGLNKFE